MKDWTLRRRELLHGLGAGSALVPLLHATKSFAATPAFPKRLVIVVVPNGYASGQFAPRGAGEDLAALTLPESLGPLEPWKRDIILFPALSNPTFVEGNLHAGYGIALSGHPGKGQEYYCMSTIPTLDQAIADAIGKRVDLPLRTLALAAQTSREVDKGVGPIRAFWRGEDQPITPEENPYKVMDTLFSGARQPDPNLAKIRAEQKSILDFLGRDVERFAARLGTEDRSSLQGHLQAIRDVEKLLAAPQQDLNTCAPASAPVGQPLDPLANDNFPTIVSVQMDLMVAALRCDVTRVATLQLGSATAAAIRFSWLGIDGPPIDQDFLKNMPEFGRSWHDCAHRELGPGGNDKVKIDKWLIGQFAALMKRLKAIPEGPGTMLDNTAILWTSPMFTGNHEHEVPWILAGHCGGYLKTGQYARSAERQATNRVLAEICNAMDVPRTSFGDPQYGGPLPGLKA